MTSNKFKGEDKGGGKNVNYLFKFSRDKEKMPSEHPVSTFLSFPFDSKQNKKIIVHYQQKIIYDFF